MGNQLVFVALVLLLLAPHRPSAADDAKDSAVFGVWSVDIATQEQKLIFAPPSAYSGEPMYAVSRDGRTAAVHGGLSHADYAALEKKDPQKLAVEKHRIAVGPVTGPLKVIWRPPQNDSRAPRLPAPLAGMPGIADFTRDVKGIRIAPDGKRVLLDVWPSIIVVSLTGQSSVFGPPANLLQAAKWTSRGSTEVLVIGGPPGHVVQPHESVLGVRAMSVMNGSSHLVAPCPEHFTGMPGFGSFHTSDDLGTVAFFSGGPGGDTNGGAWLARRGQLPQVARGTFNSGAVSPDGRYVAGLLGGIGSGTSLCLLFSADGKELWKSEPLKVDQRTTNRTRDFLAFDASGKRLLLAVGPDLLLTPTDKYDPKVLASTQPDAQTRVEELLRGKGKSRGLGPQVDSVPRQGNAADNAVRVDLPYVCDPVWMPGGKGVAYTRYDANMQLQASRKTAK